MFCYILQNGKKLSQGLLWLLQRRTRHHSGTQEHSTTGESTVYRAPGRSRATQQPTPHNRAAGHAPHRNMHAEGRSTTLEDAAKQGTAHSSTAHNAPYSAAQNRTTGQQRKQHNTQHRTTAPGTRNSSDQRNSTTQPHQQNAAEHHTEQRARGTHSKTTKNTQSTKHSGEQQHRKTHSGE